MKLSAERNSTTAKRERGFSLVELLVAVAMLMITLPFLVHVEVNSIKANTRADELTLVSSFAVSKAEELQAMPYDLVDDGEQLYTLPNGLEVAVIWEVDKDEPVKGCKTVTLVSGRETIKALKDRVNPLIEISVVIWENL